MNKKTRVYLGLGSNLGDKKENLQRAIDHLSLALGLPVAVSTFIESEPWGFCSRNTFVNCVVAFETTLTPTELLDATEEIEKNLGRTQKSTNGQYGDRPIDIDILFYGSETIATPRLAVPHPLLHKRHFVLAPLKEIAPTLVHPTIGKTIDRLHEELKKSL